MIEPWKSQYLLNLVLVARVDGELRPIEVLFLSKCRRAIDADGATLADAVMRSYWESCDRTGGLITDERLLRDMVVMSVLDGRTSPEEQECVFRFVDRAAIGPDRLAAIVREALLAVQAERAHLEVDVQTRYLGLAG